MSADVSIVIAAHNTRVFLEQSLAAIGNRHEVTVVDTGSTDRSQALVRERFPRVRLLELDTNAGYGRALNAGIASSSGELLVLMNGDAWPLPGSLERLVEAAESEPGAGILGPRLLNPDGTLQPSVRGFPTLWRLGTEYLFLRWLAPRSRALNAFYGSGFDHRSRREAEFLVGAVLLVRRQLVVGHAARLDDHELVPWHARGQVPAGPDDEPVARKLRVQLADLPPDGIELTHGQAPLGAHPAGGA